MTNERTIIILRTIIKVDSLLDKNVTGVAKETKVDGALQTQLEHKAK